MSLSFILIHLSNPCIQTNTHLLLTSQAAYPSNTLSSLSGQLSPGTQTWGMETSPGPFQELPAQMLSAKDVNTFHLQLILHCSTEQISGNDQD